MKFGAPGPSSRPGHCAEGRSRFPGKRLRRPRRGLWPVVRAETRRTRPGKVRTSLGIGYLPDRELAAVPETPLEIPISPGARGTKNRSGEMRRGDRDAPRPPRLTCLRISAAVTGRAFRAGGHRW
jgi:hypothetical protein